MLMTQRASEGCERIIFQAKKMTAHILDVINCAISEEEQEIIEVISNVIFVSLLYFVGPILL